MSGNTPVSKRELILKAAAEIFSAKGFYHAKIEEIAQEAGIGKGTVYEYFRSKEHLFSELIKEGYELFLKLTEEEIDQAGDTRTKLEGLIRLGLKYYRQYRPLARVAMLETIPADDIFRNWLRESHKNYLKIIEGVINRGIANKEIRPIDARIFAMLYYGGMGMMANPLMDIDMDDEELEELAAQIVDYYFTGISWDSEKER